MAHYLEVFVIPVPKKNLNQYKKLAKPLAKGWIRAGAISYTEAVADDVLKGKHTSFPRSVELKPNEIVVFGYAVFKSRQHRDKAMVKIHNDPSLKQIWEAMPFDGMRMFWGGFKSIVSA